MPSASSPSGRAGAGACRRLSCGRGDLLTLAVAAMLCSATYCFSIWHNGRNAPDKIALGPAAFVSAGAALCGGDADAAELDFEAHHTAERAGLSVSSSTAAPATGTGKRRALRSAAEPVDTAGRRGVVNGNGLARLDGSKQRFTYGGAVLV